MCVCMCVCVCVCVCVQVTPDSLLNDRDFLSLEEEFGAAEGKGGTCACFCVCMVRFVFDNPTRLCMVPFTCS